MSEATSVLNKARFDGLVTVEEAGLQGMITLRGDLSSSALAGAVKAATGCALPDRRRIVHGAEGAVGWMSPDELLLLCPYGEAAAKAAALADALSGEHALAVNVSDARAFFRLSGGAVREVIAKLAPVDMAPGVFAVGELRRSRLAQVAGAFWLTDETTAQLVCFRSVAGYVNDLLCTAADPKARVGFF
ncbi:sarcosine oxidase subunit gamma [Aestuariicoccus sp. MJ-SS9]|uniref:sarcosine oxidase subunit gamma n=1 Tax=Aestuariicoccus sp. MJ-SS9 TaxID=3079855 RepID=UPI002909933C|nr:sarcosine oxidase subunit gamma family protein [Aestuariicoccus sp. MJ-SS9]MDU8912567.1 sarcosine oxidase subunit gamma family protein [Aestuariicoccus sp. MJ-SS9]